MKSERTYRALSRQIRDRYPLRVAEAYRGDIELAASDSGEQVAATVAAWEKANGLAPLDWGAIRRAQPRVGRISRTHAAV